MPRSRSRSPALRTQDGQGNGSIEIGSSDTQIQAQQQNSLDKSACCSRWPICTKGDKCNFYHPQLPCLAYPSCPFANECLLIHPVCECPDGNKCKKAKCNYVHPPAETRNSRGTICKYHPKCTNRECPYLHPEVPVVTPPTNAPKTQNLTTCKYGVLCTRADCYFYHPEMKILPQTGGYPPTPCRNGPHCTTSGCMYLHDPILTTILTKLQQAGTYTLASIGLNLESILPHLAASSAAQLIPAVNPAVLPATSKKIVPQSSSPPPSLPVFNYLSVLYGAAGVPSQINPPSMEDDVPYLPSDNSPPRRN